jgi:hypothetical protein
MSHGPAGVTVDQLNAYTEYYMQLGQGKNIVALDRRGLDYLLEKHLPTAGLSIPPDGEQCGGDRVFLRLAF